MSEFIKEKLFVDIEENLESEKDLTNRKYTLTHSDETGNLYLYIGENYAIDKIKENRDEVLANWIKISETYILRVNLHLDLEYNDRIEIRDIIFREELPLALKAIVYGDRKLYINKRELINAPVLVYFNSSDPKYNKVEKWGNVKDYIIGENKRDWDNSILDINIKDRVILTMLTPQIEKELKKLYGESYRLCLNFASILSITPLSPPFSCSGSYIITVQIREIEKFINLNSKIAIIEFIVKSGEVKVKSVKNPR